MKIIRKIPPVDFLDIAGIEAWLEAQEAKGLRFHKTGGFFIQFTSTAPAQVRYHAEPVDAVSPSLAGEQTAYSARRGWVFAGRFGYFNLFRSADPDTEDFHTDPVAQAYTLRKLIKRLSIGVAICIPLLIGLIALQIFAHYDSAFGSAMRFVKFSNLSSSFHFLLCCFLVFHLCRQTFGIHQLKKRLSLGIPRQRQSTVRYTAWARHLIYLLSYTLGTLALILSVYSMTAGRWQAELDQAQKPYPLLSLETLSPGLELTKEEFGYPGYEGPDRDNYVEYDWRVPAEIYEIQQHATYNSGQNRTYLWIHWYDLHLPFLAAPLTQDLMDYHCYELEYTPERLVVEELDSEGFDRFTLVREPEFNTQRLFVRIGDRVAFLYYSGPSDLADYADEIRNLLEVSV